MTCLSIYDLPPPPMSPTQSPTRPPSYHRRSHGRRTTNRRISTSSISSSSTTSSLGGPHHSSSHFEVVLPPSPASLPASHLNAMPFEEIPRARVSRALDSLQAVLDRAGESISSVIAMREQQAGFLGYQERLLAQLKEEHATVEEEVTKKKQELEMIDTEMATFSEKKKKRPALRPRTNRAAKGTREGWTNTLHRTFHVMRTRSMP